MGRNPNILWEGKSWGGISHNIAWKSVCSLFYKLLQVSSFPQMKFCITTTVSFFLQQVLCCLVGQSCSARLLHINCISAYILQIFLCSEGRLLSGFNTIFFPGCAANINSSNSKQTLWTWSHTWTFKNLLWVLSQNGHHECGPTREQDHTYWL